MTLLSIVNGIADYTSGPRPASIAGNTNPDAQNYLRVVNKVGKKLMKVYPWNILRKENTFTAGGTETLVAAASMPSDFDRFIAETFWDQGTARLVSGPISATEWRGLKASSYNGDEIKFIYRGGDILATPTVGSGSSMVFEYISNQYVESNAAAPQTSFQADTDVSILDEELITLAATYDWLASESLPSNAAFKDFKDYFDMLQDNENATAMIAVAGDIFSRDSRHFSGAPVASRTTVYSY